MGEVRPRVDLWILGFFLLSQWEPLTQVNGEWNPSLVRFNGLLKLVLLSFLSVAYITEAKHFWDALEAFWNACRERKCSLMRMWMDISPDGCCRHYGMSCFRSGTKHTREILGLSCFTTSKICHACWELTLKQWQIWRKMIKNQNV